MNNMLNITGTDCLVKGFKYSNLGISPTSPTGKVPYGVLNTDSARMFSYVSPKQGFVRNPMPTASAGSGNNSMLNMLMKNLDNMR